MTDSNDRCLAVLTARGGSKGVPNKNVRQLNGIPTIGYTLHTAQQCDFISKIIVTTDSEDIRQAALKFRVEAPFLRPAELATDTAKQEDVILHAMDWYESRGEKFDYLCLLDPTVPLRQVSSLINGFALLKRNANAGAVVSVTESAVTPLICNTWRADGFMKGWMDEKYKWANRQEMPVFYRLCGAVFISRWNVFRKKRSFLHDKTLSLAVDEIEAIDINSPLDYFLVERLMEYEFVNSAQLRQYVQLQNPEKIT